MRKPTQETLDEVREQALEGMETNPELRAWRPEMLETYRQTILVMTSSPEAFMRLAPLFEKKQEASPATDEASRSTGDGHHGR